MLTLLPLRYRAPTARWEPARYLLKVNMIVPILIKGMKQAWKIGENVSVQISQKE